MAPALERLAFDLNRAAVETVAATKLLIYRTGLDSVGYAKGIVPVRTGVLKSSIGVRYDSGMSGFDLEAEAEYASYVEEGTTVMAPHPFLGPAMDRAINEVTVKLAVIGQTSLP